MFGWNLATKCRNTLLDYLIKILVHEHLCLCRPTSCGERCFLRRSFFWSYLWHDDSRVRWLNQHWWSLTISWLMPLPWTGNRAKIFDANATWSTLQNQPIAMKYLCMKYLFNIAMNTHCHEIYHEFVNSATDEQTNNAILVKPFLSDMK